MRYDRARLDALKVMACDRLPEVLGALGITLRNNSRYYAGPCPIHGGDNPNGLLLYPEGDTCPGYWQCNTRHCEEIFHPNIIGFVRGVLSAVNFNWSGKGGKEATFWDSVNFICRTIGVNYDDIPSDGVALEKRNYIAKVTTVNRPRPIHEQGKFLSREDVRSRLVIPAPYFLQRGFSPKVLDRYDVGLSIRQGAPMCGRAVVPIYDDDGKRLVGATARSPFEKCPQCSRYHDPAKGCPPQTALARPEFSKWRHSEGFHADAHLYNFWFAKKFIRESGVVVLVEGPGDVWRSVSSGIYNSVALFGTSLSDEQQILLELSGAMSVVILTDMDEAGQRAGEILTKKLSRAYRVVRPELPCKDVGEMTVGQVKEFLLPLANKGV